MKTIKIIGVFGGIGYTRNFLGIFVLICITLFCKNTRTFQRIKSCHYFLIIRLLRLYQRSVVIFMHNINFGLDLVPGATNALFADFADVLVACFIGFAGFIALFRQLHHDEFAVPTVLGVQLHDCVSGGGGAREEVENNILFLGNPTNNPIHYIKTFFSIEYCIRACHHYIHPIITQ